MPSAEDMTSASTSWRSCGSLSPERALSLVLARVWKVVAWGTRQSALRVMPTLPDSQ